MKCIILELKSPTIYTLHWRVNIPNSPHTYICAGTQIVQTDEKLRSDGPLYLHDRAIVHEYTIFLPIMTM